MNSKTIHISAACVAAALCAFGRPSPTVVHTVHPTWEVVVADDVMSPPAAGTDAAPEIQKRMDALAKESAGGTLFLKAGVYTIVTPVILPPNVTLKGDYDPADARTSTRLSIVCGRGDEKGLPAFQIGPGGGLQGLFFHYPEQSLASPVPYPWTASNALRTKVAHDNQTICDCTFVNSWQAIAIGPHGNELHTLRNVRMCALRKGVFIDSTTDTGRTEDVTVAPRFWCESGLVGAPSEEALRNYLRSNDTTGYEVGRSDWENIWRLKVDGYRTGCRFTRGKRGLSNAVMAECSFTRCGTGLEVDALNGVGLGVYDASFAGCDRSVYGTTNFQTVVQLLACDFGGKPPINGGGAYSTFLISPEPSSPTSNVQSPKSKVQSPKSSVQPPLARHVPMVWPRPKSEKLFVATDFGASPTNRDNAAAIAAACAAARAAGGGTVYLPGGQYFLRKGVTVPSGVELRGNAAMPHHTATGGTVLLACAGKGAEDGEPLVSLERESGLRGVTVWYPENPIFDPVPYPWTVRSLGTGCWLVDVNIANAWQAVDFHTHPSTGHRISYLSGNAWRRGLFVGKCAGPGWVENTQFNPHYANRLPPELPRIRGTAPAFIPARRAVGQSPESHWMRKRLEAHLFEDCADEHLLSTFVYAATDGIAFRGLNRITSVIHGTDTGARCMEIAQKPGSVLNAALCQITPFETLSGKESAGFHFAPEDAGESFFNLSQLWVRKPTAIGEGRGTAHFAMANSLSTEAELRSGTFHFSDFRFQDANCDGFAIGPEAKVTRRNCGLYDYPNAPRPKDPPVDIVVDFKNVTPSENIVGRYGCIREAETWCTHVFGNTYRFRASLKNKPHVNAYTEFLKGVAIPVYPSTTVSYRIRSRSAAVAYAQDVAFDFHFTDGSTMRDSPHSSWPSGALKRGEWKEIKYRLHGSIGKTIDYIMIRLDKRNVPAAVYEADFDSFRIVTPR